MNSRLPKLRRPATDSGLAPGHAAFDRVLADAIPQMVWSTTADGFPDFFNAHYLAYAGMGVEQLSGLGYREIIHPEDRESAARAWALSLASGQRFQVEYRLRRHDGAYLWHLGSALPQVRGGRILRWFGTCTDIDEQKKATRLLEQARQTLEALVAARNQAIEANSQRLRSFLDSMPAVAWIKDAQQRYVWLSASYTRMFGKSIEQLRGRHATDVWADGAFEITREDERALRVDGPVQSSHDFRRSDGSTVRLRVIRFPFPDMDDGRGIASIAFEADDTANPGADARGPIELLSARERQVLQLIVDGRTSAEAGEILNLSPKSVETYRSRLMAKLQLEDLPSLVKFAIRHGLTSVR